MRSVRDIRVLENVPVLVRGALNVPVAEGAVANDYRLRRALPTLRFLKERGARIILIGHSGDKGTETLRPIAETLSTLLPNVSFFPETVGPRAREAVRALLPGDVLVLENLRRDKGEEQNAPAFARELAALADAFVQDSFDTCHRPHASIIGVTELLPSYAGLLLEEEIRELSGALAPKGRSLAVIGGAKFATKERVLKTLLERYDHVFIGGALSTNFLKAAGHEVGKSLVGAADPARLKEILKHPRLLLPLDSLVVPASGLTTSDPHAHARAALLDEVGPEDVILDHGPRTAEMLEHHAREAKTILWNGPLGNYERGFTDVTDAFARATAESSARTVIGGGDTVAAVERIGLESRFSFVSTGGGAMLDFLAAGTLPGIEALG